MTAPTGKPAMIRGNDALIPAMSRSRPPWAPMNTKPSWMRIGKSTRSGAETHAPSPPDAMTQAAPIATAAPPRTTRAMRRWSTVRAVRATAPDTTMPAAPIAM